MGPVEETVAMWIMLVMNLLFLISRLYLRRRQWQGVRWSDILIIISFIVILAETCLFTRLNVYEQNYIKNMYKHPDLYMGKMPDTYDPVRWYFVYEKEWNIQYLKWNYVVLYFNILALWLSKLTLLAFFFEVFPPRSTSPILRRFLYAAAFYIAATGLANLFETIFWCLPHQRMWDPVSVTGKLADYCLIKVDAKYNATQFATHLTSTLILASLPCILLAMHHDRRERAFAITVLVFGTISIAAAITAYIMMISLRFDEDQSSSNRHNAVLAVLADQNALFLAACVSVVKISVRKKRELETESAQALDTGVERMEIQVEKSWRVDVEIVTDLGRKGGQRGEDKDVWRWGVETDTDAIRLTGRCI